MLGIRKSVHFENILTKLLAVNLPVIYQTNMPVFIRVTVLPAFYLFFNSKHKHIYSNQNLLFSLQDLLYSIEFYLSSIIITINIISFILLLFTNKL